MEGDIVTLDGGFTAREIGASYDNVAKSVRFAVYANAEGDCWLNMRTREDRVVGNPGTFTPIPVQLASHIMDLHCIATTSKLNLGVNDRMQ